MKFWISLIVGVVVLTGISTVMVVLNPDLAVQREVSQEPEVPTGPQPQLVVENTEATFDNVGQGIVDSTTFLISNKGEGDLQLVPYYPNCTCAGLKVSRKTPTDLPEDFISLEAVDKKWKTKASENNPGHVRVPPGGSAEIVVQWDTTGRQGQYSVNAEVRSNDPNQKTVKFRVNLHVKKDVMYHEQRAVEFGVLSQGEKSERTILIYSPIRDDLKFESMSTTTAALQYEQRPIPADLAASLPAKSGALIAVISDGTLPEGHFRHELQFTTNFNPAALETVPITGLVRGKMELLPSIIDFKVAAAGKPHEVAVKVFAHGLEKERKLTIAELTPKFLSATLEQSSEFPALWNLKVKMDASAPAGTFEGNLSIADDQGVKRINIPTKGVIAGTGTDAVTTK